MWGPLVPNQLKVVPPEMLWDRMCRFGLHRVNQLFRSSDRHEVMQRLSHNQNRSEAEIWSIGIYCAGLWCARPTLPQWNSVISVDIMLTSVIQFV